jgi:hypothetical protein
MIDSGLLVSSAYFHSHINSESFFFFVKNIKIKRDFSSLPSHSAIIIFNAIIWHNIYFDFIEEGERRKEKGERPQRKWKNKKRER